MLNKQVILFKWSLKNYKFLLTFASVDKHYVITMCLLHSSGNVGQIRALCQ